MYPFRRISLRRLNDLLSVGVIGIAIYIFMLPFLPQVSWWLNHSAPILSRSARQVASAPLPVQIPKDNRLVIPALSLDEPIYIGDDISTVDKGVWIRPNASTPEQGGNTVLVGHRFTYADPRGVFYYLDKVKVDDIVTVYWKEEAFSYKVREISIAQPTDTTVEQPSLKNILTLYTCAPLWSLKERLVIVGDLIEEQS